MEKKDGLMSYLGKGGLWVSLLPFAWGMSGCVSPDGGGNSIVARDVLEIKHLMEEQKKNDESAQRKMDYRLEALEEKLQSRTDQLRASLNDLEQPMATQKEDMDKLRKQVEDISYSVSGLNGKMQQTETAAATPAATPEPAAQPAPKRSGEELYTDALKEYNLGHYSEARKGFEAAEQTDLPRDQGLQNRYWLGETCYALGEYEPAGKKFREVIKTDNTHALAWRSLERLAQINQKKGDTPNAIKLYSQIIEVNPSYEGIDRVKEQVAILKKGALPADEEEAEPAPKDN